MECFSRNPFDLPFAVLYTSEVLKAKLTSKEVKAGMSDRDPRTRLLFTRRVRLKPAPFGTRVLRAVVFS